MSLVASDKLATLQKALQKSGISWQKKYCIQTFGCQMNHADSEKIQMLLTQAGLAKVDTWEEADIVIFNTCSVRQKWEDKVFGFIEEIDRLRLRSWKDIKVGLTGCMTRKTGLHKKYYDYQGRKNTTKIELLDFSQKHKAQSTKHKDGYVSVILGQVNPLRSLRLWGMSIAQTRMSRDERDPGIQENKLSAMAETSNVSGLDSRSTWISTFITRSEFVTPPLRGNDGNVSIFNSDDELFGRTENIDFVVRIEEIGSLTTLFSIMYGEDIGQDDTFQSYLRVRQERDTSWSANVIIQTGCDNYCTFCIVPYTRGHEISRSMDDIVAEVTEAVQHGAKEVTLLGQNVNSYGKETRKALWNAEELKWHLTPNPSPLKGEGKGTGVLRWGLQSVTPFRELLENLNTIQGLDRIRFTSSNPHDMTRDILDAHFDLEKCCHFLHFALQSGDNDVLKKMNRKHSYEDFKTMVDYLRCRDPLFGISTDVIVGFPWETDEQFENTVKAFHECQFDFAYIARYSPRKLTYAAKMPDQIPAEVKAKRWDKLNSVMYEIIQQRNEMMIGREEVILVSKIDEEDGTISGRTRNFREVYLPKNEKIKLGDLIPVKILELDRWVLKGQVL